MKQILVLTKNVLVDQEFQNELQNLNYEVFCSSYLFYQLFAGNLDVIKVISSYSIVIFSETIADVDLKIYLEKLKNSTVSIVRKGGAKLTNEELEKWNLLGLHSFFYDGMTKMEIREQLSTLMMKQNNVVGVNTKDEATIKKDFSKLSRVRLSMLERRLLETLYQHSNESLSRKELCKYIWDEHMGTSRSVHLSNLVGKVRKKLIKIGFSEQCIRTDWGYGYQISDEVYQWYAEARKII
ncbi:winged helix-turn-helix domain-containing protein [Candidatus Enterococcus murrayae]|uniref:Winged helix-turn-helix domain-containing protein n=1 Tax=Candidatus Enterococcus murrayae TaxID=2815321 RepID=A0ABS3HNS5_9ENTE|nr:helix-turn-helix domain-containing protein [Enterococcus sp. MJM16]MBO0455111.1 winged helix-turn-helix domain-containing protein [Enterococcus sp. MJM16]